jgi:NADPH:quinone reductase-like Zn-dependent oxidoreductase
MLLSPVNPSDLLFVRGVYGKPPGLPATPGFEGVGVVEASGGGWLADRCIGRRVVVLNARPGAWAEFAVVSAGQAIPVSEELPTQQAAMFFVNPAAAYVMTRKVLRIPRGEWLLQSAAGSALGRMVIRLGRRCGFRTLNVIRCAAQADELRQLGADVVISFDAARQEPHELAEAIASITTQDVDARGQLVPCETHSRGIRFAIDAVGGTTGSQFVRCLAGGGRLLVYGTLSNEPLIISPRDLMANGSHVEGFWLGPWMRRQSLLGKLRLIRALSRLLRDGVLTSEVGQEFSLDRITAAVQAAESARHHGKTLLRTAHA